MAARRSPGGSRRPWRGPTRGGWRRASAPRRHGGRPRRAGRPPSRGRRRPPRRRPTRAARRRVPPRRAPAPAAARPPPRRPRSSRGHRRGPGRRRRREHGRGAYEARVSFPAATPEKASTRMAVTDSPAFYEQTEEQRAIIEMVRQFVDEQIIPKAEHYDAHDEFPEPIVEQMKELGLFGVTIPEEFGGMGLDLTTYTMIVEELSRGWISISGVVNTHFIGSYLLMKFGTDEQKEKFLPRMATGEIRAAFSLSEPELGSDVQAIKTSAV